MEGFVGNLPSEDFFKAKLFHCVHFIVVTLVEMISVFGCFFKIFSSIVFQNRGAGLARIRLCGRPKEGGRNTKAKLAIKRKYQHKNHFVLRYNPLEFDNRIFEWICCFSGDKGDNGRKSRFHEVFEKSARGN